MEFQKIVNFLDTPSNDKGLPRFVTKKWIEVYDQPGGNYNVNKEIRIKTLTLRSDLCDYSDAYIAVKEEMTLGGDNDANKRNKNLAFKNNAPFINCISKQQVVCGIITEMNQLILFLLILNLLNTRQVL